MVSIRLHDPTINGFDTHYLPDGFQATAPVTAFISDAYSPSRASFGSTSKVVNAPDWAYRDFYDIQARVSQDDVAAWHKAYDTNHDIYQSVLLQQGLQAALEDRAKLALHITQTEQSCLDLVLGKQALKLNPTVPGAIKPVPGKSNKLGDGFYIEDNGKRQFVGVTMQEFAGVLLTRLNGGHLVQDKTGLTGRYDFTLSVDNSPDDGGTTTQLDRMPVTSVGLALKPGTAPFFNVYIDHIEKPDAN